MSQAWQSKDARAQYNTTLWGEGYVDVSDDGHLLVRPRRDQRAVDLPALLGDLHAEGLELPVLLRFNNILHDRVDALTGAFAQVIKELDYGSSYTAVYPIKVNQQRSVVEQIVAHGGKRVGLEAGSKPELMAVLAATVEVSTISLPRASGTANASTSSSTCSSAVTHRNSTSACARQATALSADSMPNSAASASALLSVRLCTTLSNPAACMFLAIGRPIAPRPMKAAFMGAPATGRCNR